MPNLLAWILVSVVGVYVVIGAAFALFFIVRGVGKLDPAAVGGTIGFRAFIFPGAVALWPFLMQRYQNRTLPVEESSAPGEPVREPSDSLIETNPIEPVREDTP